MALEEKLDMISLNSTDVKELEKFKKKNWKEVISNLSQDNFLVLNPNKVSKQWRKYFFQNFSTDELVKKLKFDNKKPAYGYVPDVLQGAIKTQFKINDEVVLHLTPLEIEIIYMDFSGVEELINYLKLQWNNKNLKLKFKKVLPSLFLQSLDTGDMQAYIATKGLDYPDAMANLSYFKSDLKSNYFFVKDEGIDKLLYKCSSLLDKKDECFIQIQKQIFDQLTVLPLFFGVDRIEMWSDKIELVPAHPLGLQFLNFDQIEIK
jgi:hypothetical protein